MFYPPQNAATSHYLGEVCRTLSKRGHEVSVISSKQEYLKGKTSLPGSEVLDGVYVKRLWGLGLGKGSGLRRLFDYGIFWLLALWELLRRPKVDVVICLTSPPMIDLIGLMHRIIYRSRLVVWSMDCYPEMLVRTGTCQSNDLLIHCLRWLRRFVAKRTDLAFALDEEMRRFLQDEGIKNVVCLYNWGDECDEPDKIIVGEMRQKLAGNARFLALYTGNLGPPHDFHTFLEIAEFFRNDRDIQFVFIGGGAYWDSLKEEIQTRRLKNFHIENYISKDQMAVALQTADLLLLCLRTEIVGVASPSKIYGYLLAGRPILFVGPEKSEAGRAVLLSGCGQVTPIGNAESGICFIQKLKENTDLIEKLGQSGNLYYKAHYGRDRSIDTFERSLQHLISSNR